MNLKIVFRFEIFAENQQLQKNQQKTENNGEITEGQRKIQAQYIWNRRNRGCTEIGFGN